jgi:hypothetical protein
MDEPGRVHRLQALNKSLRIINKSLSQHAQITDLSTKSTKSWKQSAIDMMQLPKCTLHRPHDLTLFFSGFMAEPTEILF